VCNHEISHTTFVLTHGNIVVLATNSSLRSHEVCRKINSITVTYNILFNNITFHRGLRGRRKEHFTIICQQIGLDFAYTCTSRQSLSPAKNIHYSLPPPIQPSHNNIINTKPWRPPVPVPSYRSTLSRRSYVHPLLPYPLLHREAARGGIHQRK
jgi:hypothetical protein